MSVPTHLSVVKQLVLFRPEFPEIDQSEAVVVRPQPFKALDITIRPVPPVDALILGDVFQGQCETIGFGTCHMQGGKSLPQLGMTG